MTDFATFYLVFNDEVPLFQNDNIRKAFQIGFDREALAYQISTTAPCRRRGSCPMG